MVTNSPNVHSNQLASASELPLPVFRPVSATSRIHTIDIIRGVALLGILLMNIPHFGVDFSTSFTILRGAKDTADFYAFAIIDSLEGTMRAIFSMLFGAGMILFTINKKETPGSPTAAEFYYRRLLWLTLFGIVNAFVLLWSGDILFCYGLCGMLLYPFRKMNPKWILFIGLFCLGIGTFKIVLAHTESRQMRAGYLEAIAVAKENKKLTVEQQAAKSAWPAIENSAQTIDSARLKMSISSRDSDYVSLFNYLLPRNGRAEVLYTYHYPWDMIGMMFIGMALLAWGFLSGKMPTSNYLMGMLVGYGIGIPLGWFMFDKGRLGSLNFADYVDAYRIPHSAVYEFRRLFLCLGHLSLILLIIKSKLAPWLMKCLANVGQMAFTNYLMQSIICALFFYGFGFGYYNKLHFHQLYYVVGGIWIFQIIFSSIWLRYYSFGPFEWVWRSLTYWKIQPMRKVNKG